MSGHVELAPDVLVLIHGTQTPVDPQDESPRWIEEGSPFVASIREAVPAVSLEVRPVYWSGVNLESDRQRAAELLWHDHLRVLEESGRNYHIVAHSHGGVIVWSLLRDMMSRRNRLTHRKLRRMRSWCTVGTPFLHYEPIRDGWWSVVTLFVPAAAAAAFGWIVGVEGWKLLTGDGLPDWGVGAVLANGVANFWAEGLTSKVVLSVACLVFIGFLIVLINYGILRPLQALVSYFSSEVRAVKSAWREFAPRWLSLHSSYDEAIHGLRHALSLRGPVVTRVTPQSRIAKVVLAPVHWIYNCGIAKLADSFIWAMLTARVQGNDTNNHLVSVSTCPHPHRRGWPSLPTTIDKKMRADADEQAGRTLKTLRVAFGLTDEEERVGLAFVNDFLDTLSWGELVHTSYFPSHTSPFSDVANLIAYHIGTHVSRTDDDSSPTVGPQRPTDVSMSPIVQSASVQVAAETSLPDAVKWYDNCQRHSTWSQPEDQDVSNARRWIELRLLSAAFASIFIVVAGAWLPTIFERIRTSSDQFEVDVIVDMLADTGLILHKQSDSLYGDPLHDALLSEDSIDFSRFSPGGLHISIEPPPSDASDEHPTFIGSLVPSRRYISSDQVIKPDNVPWTWPAHELITLVGADRSLETWTDTSIEVKVHTSQDVVRAFKEIADPQTAASAIARITREIAMSKIRNELLHGLSDQRYSNNTPLSVVPYARELLDLPSPQTSVADPQDYYLPILPLSVSYGLAGDTASLEMLIHQYLSQHAPFWSPDGAEDRDWGRRQLEVSELVLRGIESDGRDKDAARTALETFDSWVLAVIVLQAIADSDTDSDRRAEIKELLPRIQLLADTATFRFALLVPVLQDAGLTDEAERIGRRVLRAAEIMQEREWGFDATSRAREVVSSASFKEMIPPAIESESAPSAPVTDGESDISGGLAPHVGEVAPSAAAPSRLPLSAKQLLSGVNEKHVFLDTDVIAHYTLVERVQMPLALVNVASVPQLRDQAEEQLTALLSEDSWWNEASLPYMVGHVHSSDEIRATVSKLLLQYAYSEKGDAATLIEMAAELSDTDLQRRFRERAMLLASEQNNVEDRVLLLQTMAINASDWQDSRPLQNRLYEHLESLLKELTVASASENSRLWGLMVQITQVRLAHHLRRAERAELRNRITEISGALQEFEVNSPEGYAVVASQTATAMGELTDDDSALRLLERAVATSRSIPDDRSRSSVLREIGIAFAVCGEYRDARQTCEGCDTADRYHVLVRILHEIYRERQGDAAVVREEFIHWERIEVESTDLLSDPDWIELLNELGSTQLPND